ncbi:ribulose-1,5 bisphosphate carboxylase/oxygenase large subunit N-methyltransferase, chloroplastic-like isoform X2 [Punica granatum]|uniref:Ribulose-1,5 bisphosphate carboxylase/oxygenase large subunit N-methyltransferase, chloroplastic-like isoform X2 n=1 Tax=Punica granatum TaxID=22663 RepID=A0A6P8E409_PUNGR|nr:ribulose-1,5 bisphosphate carboxylase/oxygenase large subunit N-methyltransferase, chloroplastic-like isoform X2 [Punica granatum]
MSTLFSFSPRSPHNAFLPLTRQRLRQRRGGLLVRFSLASLDFLDSDPPLPPAVQTFWKWMTEEGVISSSTCPLKPAYVPEGLGLIARRDIAEDEIILRVPRRLWVNPDTVAASEIGYLCTDLKPWAQVSLFLTRERLRPNSSWRFYIDILPEKTNSTIYWSEEELAELKGTLLLRMTKEMKEYVKSEFLKIEQEIIRPNKELFPSSITLDDFYWAFGMIRSRAFSRLTGQLAMLPLVDFINHSSKITREDNAEEMNGPAGLFSWDLLFCLKSTIPVKEGEQVFIQYGLKKNNADLALYYGFVERNSARDAYTFTFSIPESDPYYGDKVEIAKENDLDETAYFDVFMDRPITQAMLQYLRVAAIQQTDAFLLEPVFKSSIWATVELPDQKLLEVGNLGERLDIAVRVRLGGKLVLQQIQLEFKERQLKLDAFEYYQERRFKELGLVGDIGEIYCQPKDSVPSV